MLKDVKEWAKQGGKETEIIVAVPNIWLRLPIIDLLLPIREGYIRVKSLPELYEKVKELPGGILIIDIFAYEDNYQDILDRLHEKNPTLVMVPLLSRDKMPYAHYLESSGSCFVVEKENANTLLLPALQQALQKRLLALNKKEVGLMENEDGSIFRKKMGRRSFLKGSAAAVAAAGVVAAAPGSPVLQALAAGSETKTGVVEDQIFYGACRANCFGGCRLKITVRNGKVVKTQMAEVPDKRYNRICARGLSHLQLIYSPDRLKYPLKRVGERGADQWEQITWEEAIKTITNTWKQIRAESGDNAVAFSFGTGSIGALSSNGFHRLANAMGASNIYGNYDSNHIITIGQCLGVGANYNANEMADLLNAKTILFFGANITEAQPHNWHFVKEAQEKGTKLICIDPVSTTLAIKSDIHVPIRPGTDAALAMAMANIIIKNNWIDETFIMKSSVGPFLVKEKDGTYLRLSDLGELPAGQQDGIVVRGGDGSVGLPGEINSPVIKGSFTINGLKVTTAYDLLVGRVAEWTPERTAELCGISVDLLEKITRIYATESPGTIYTGFGPDHYANGDHAYMAIFTLGMITGNFGKPGASTGWPLNVGVNINGAAIQELPGSPKAGPTLPQTKIPFIMENKKYGGKPFELRSIYNLAGNPIANAAGRQELLQAYSKLDLHIVADWRMTDTARYADLVLPVAHWFEAEEIVNAGQTTWTSIQEKAVEPQFEAKSDWDILRLLAEGMGYEHFSYSESEMLQMACEGPAPAAFGTSYEKLKKEKVIKGAFPDKTYIYGEDGVFGTATGRVQFYFENPQPDYLYDPEKQKIDTKAVALPAWEPPFEAWPETVGGFDKKPLAAKYPLIYTSQRNKLKTHTIFGHNPWLLELYPEPTIRVSPSDAQARGIAQGDYAKVYNDRGYAVLKVVISNGVRPGMVVVPKGWQKDQFKEGHYSDLVGNIVDDYRQNNNYFDTLCEIEKI